MLELSQWNPESALIYKWTYSYKEIVKFATRKRKLYFEQRSTDYEFLVSLATAALGGKKSEEEIGLDDGEGLDELTDEQIANLKLVLGKDFATLYPALADEAEIN